MTDFQPWYFYVKSTDNVLWEMTGDKGDEWFIARVNLPSTSDYNIVFEATRGSSYRGDISLDDVTIMSRECPTPCEYLAIMYHL